MSTHEINQLIDINRRCHPTRHTRTRNRRKADALDLLRIAATQRPGHKRILSEVWRERIGEAKAYPNNLVLGPGLRNRVGNPLERTNATALSIIGKLTR